ncbi:MAG: glycosyltransferase family A protein [Bryobacteraceae bacterium]
MTPRVSMVVLAFGETRFLGEAIESCMVQTMPDFELLVALPPGAVAGSMVDRYCAIDSRIRLVESDSIADAAGQCLCDIVACLEASDVALPHRIERQLGYLDRHPEIDGVSGGTVCIRADGHPFIGFPHRDSSPSLTAAMFRHAVYYDASVSSPAAKIFTRPPCRAGFSQRGTSVPLAIPAPALGERAMWGRLQPARDFSPAFLPGAVVKRRIFPGMTVTDPLRAIFEFSAAGYHAEAARVARSVLDSGGASGEIANHLRGIVHAAEAIGADQ